jgi:hypothetical protein
MLVIQIANYLERLGPSGIFAENYTKLTCLEITGYQIKYSTVSWLLELQIRGGRKGLDTGTYCKYQQLNFNLPMKFILKEKSNYADFLLIRMACRPN